MSAPSTLRLPPPPSPPERPPFPILATIAPLGASLVLWAVTGSPFALVFGLLGPVIAIASMLDGRRSRRRAARRAEAAHATALIELEARISAAHDAERASAGEGLAGPYEVLARGETLTSRWLGRAPGRVVLGRGERPSAVRLEGDATEERTRTLLARAAELRDAPVVAALGGGIGIVGAPRQVRALARAVLVQAVHALGPHRLGVRTAVEGVWLEQSEQEDVEFRLVVAGPGPGAAVRPGDLLIALAPRIEELPLVCETLVVVDGPLSARAIQDGRETAFAPALLGETETADWAAAELGRARELGLIGRSGGLDAAVPLAELPCAAPGEGSGLAVAIGLGRAGPLVIDLVGQGPHALVAGTTGSGKSELLITWVTALAAAYPSDVVSFLLVDFKGGAAFDRVASLPHVVGVITDLDEIEVGRAIASLSAELRHRERVLRAAGAAAVEGLEPSAGLARLVVVVDEFPAMLARFPELQGVFDDLAARGRSLGVHLVLGTQRVAGVVRDTLLANCALRIALRLLDVADSATVIGSARAAALAGPGRCLVRGASAEPVEGRVAVTSPDDVAGIAARPSRPARRPWLDPLPAVLSVGEASRLAAPTGAGIAFGVCDDPGRQRRLPAEWDPRTDGPLLVAGGARSGVTTVLRAIAAASAPARIVMPRDDVEAWNAIEELGASVATPTVLVVDDLDALALSLGPEYQQQALERLIELLRGGVPGLAVVAGAHGTVGGALGARFTARLLLRHESRHELAQAGGDPALWSVDDRPGAGQWRRLRVQVVTADLASAAPAPRPPALDPGEVTAIVSAAPALTATRWQAAFPGRGFVVLDGAPNPSHVGSPQTSSTAVLLGDPETWTAHWALLAAARAGGIAVDGGLADLRTVVRGRALPAPLRPGQLWLVPPGSPPVARRWPTPGAADSEEPAPAGN